MNPIRDDSRQQGAIRIVLAGQSNMVGRGKLDRSSFNSNPDDRVWTLTADGFWEIAREPLHFGIEKGNDGKLGVGPGLSMARGLVDSGVFGKVELIPCAQGGTSIRRWIYGGDAFESMVKRIKQSRIIGSNSTEFSTPATVYVWYQGETDMHNNMSPYDYEHLLIRHLLNAIQLMGDDVFIIVVILCSDTKSKGGNSSMDVEGVDLRSYQNAQRRAARAIRNVHPGGVSVVELPSPELMEDGIHLTTNSQKRLGGLISEAILYHHRAV